MSKKYAYIALFFLLIPGVLFAADDADIGSFERYKENVKQYCESPNGNLWGNWKEYSLLKNTNPPFAEITDPKMDDTYRSYLAKIQADSAEINNINLKTGSDMATQVEKAAFLYRSNMNALYACAIMNAKIRISNDIAKLIPTGNSNLKSRLKSTIEATEQRMQAQQCNAAPDQKWELSLKKVLLDNTMYQYCHYRYYLSYLQYNAVNNYNSFVKVQNNKVRSGDVPTNTQTAINYVGKLTERIDNEIAHSKTVYPQALVAYSEFERTYGTHIVLTLIYDDYIEIRNNLKKLMNPIGQVVYKAFYAQGKK